jgi:hypothetical protein
MEAEYPPTLDVKTGSPRSEGGWRCRGGSGGTARPVGGRGLTGALGREGLPVSSRLPAAWRVGVGGATRLAGRAGGCW